MHQFALHRTPTAGVDAIDHPEIALHLVGLALADPPAHQTVLLALDHRRRGRAIVVVDGTREPDATIAVVERMLVRLTDPDVAALVVATSRPGAGLLPFDADRWFEMSDLADHEGIELVEWFVIGGDRADVVQCPRDLLGVRPRW